ncbi:hypothetical protein [Streptomyces sp. S186]|uniref:hypothetical protein n=1 Tax=Streptomyces sp. S186 TaxID=3434395 RepID=UPI003F661BF5
MAGSPAEPTGDTLRLSAGPIRRTAPKPIFVDASGGRRRRLRLLVAALVAPAMAYVALLVSTLLGGPTLPALLPHPMRPKPGAGAVAAHKTRRAQPSPTAAATPQRHRSPGRTTTVPKAIGGASAKAKSPSTAKPSPTAKASPRPKPSESHKPSPGHKPSPHPKQTPSPTPSFLPPTHGTL